MHERQIQRLDELAVTLITPDRQFPPSTPHTYAHVGDAALQDTIEFDVLQAYPDIPETRQAFRPLPTDTERTLERLDRLGRLG